MPKNLDEEARECRRHAEGCAQEAGAQTDQKLKEALFELQRHCSGAPMTPRLFCRAGQRVKFGDQLIMRRKPADDLVSHGLFGRHKAAPDSGTIWKLS
jgi:hypothetical protein